MANKRKQFTGRLCVYRESCMRDSLSANVRLDDDTQFTYYNCPKAFDDLIEDPTDNVKMITFTANEDGSNPRAVSLA